MELVYLTILLALLEYIVMGALVGRARAKHGIHAPAMTGHPDFERANRVHVNTLENLIIFIPAVWLFATYVSVPWAAGLGFLFVAARAAVRRRLSAGSGEAQHRRRYHGHRRNRLGRRRPRRSRAGAGVALRVSG